MNPLDEALGRLAPPTVKEPVGQLSMFNTHHDNVFAIDVYRIFIDAVPGGCWRCRIFMEGRTDPVFTGSRWQVRTMAIHQALNAVARGKTADRKEVPTL